MPLRPKPLAELLSIALPTVAQMASYTVMQFIDTWMLSRPSAGGELAAMSAANSGMFNFAALSLGMGTLYLVNTLVSQSFGRKDFTDCGRYLWQGIWLSLVYGLFLLALIPAGQPIFHSLFRHSIEQSNLETAYWRIVILAAIVKLLGLTFAQFLLGINRPRSVLAAAIFGTSVNALAAWCVVLGHFGFSSHGIVGAAWSQNIGVSVEMCVLLLFATRSSARKIFNAGDFRFRWNYFLTLLRVGIPSGLQWFSDILAWGFFCNGVLALIGPAAMEANTFMLRYMVVSFMPIIGIGVAVTALVGRYIGAGQPDVAAQRANMAFYISFVYACLCGATYIAFPDQLMRLFTADPEVIRIGRIYLYCAAVYEFFDAMYIIYLGALRGAGDTVRPAIVMTTFCWVISIFGAYIVAIWNRPLGVGGPWYMGCLYGFSVGVYMLLRFRGGKWRQIKLHSNSNEPLPSATLAAS
jgi:MATE family multidrug resistance protein